jgi:uncharacterized protein (DUF433 family)
MKKRNLTDDEIDALVIAEADDPLAWGDPIVVPASASPRPAWMAEARRLEQAANSISRPVLVRDPDILSGTPVFAGTRVPVKNLLDSLEHGHSLDEFLDDFPTVRREQAIAALEDAMELLLVHTPATR